MKQVGSLSFAAVSGRAQTVQSRPNILWLSAEDFGPDLGSYEHETKAEY